MFKGITFVLSQPGEWSVQIFQPAIFGCSIFFQPWTRYVSQQYSSTMHYTAWAENLELKLVCLKNNHRLILLKSFFTLFDMMAPQNVFDHCAKRLGGGSWNLVTFNINLFSIKKSYFWFPRLSSVTMVTSLSGGTRDFLKLSFHMFP